METNEIRSEDGMVSKKVAKIEGHGRNPIQTRFHEINGNI